MTGLRSRWMAMRCEAGRSVEAALDVSAEVAALPGLLGARRPARLVHLGDRLRPAHGERLEDRLALLLRRWQRVADDPARAEVARRPGACGAAIGREQL